MAGGAFVKSYNVQINDIISQTGTTPAANLSLLLTTKRGNTKANPALTLNPLTIDIYNPVIVPPQYTANGSTALSWAKSVGGTVQLGTSGSLTLSTPNTVALLQGGSYVSLTWDAEPYGWADLLGGGVTGSVTQAGTVAATGSLYMVSQSGYTLTLSNVTGSFDNNHAITVSYVNASSPIPNGTQTEQWILDLYYACEALNLQNTLNLTFNRPSITLSLLSARDTTFNPSATSTVMGSPDTYALNGDGTVILTWDVAPANWLLLPQQAVGNSKFLQGTVSGVIVQQLGPTYTTSGSGVAILLDNITGGTFAASVATTMVLDDTVSVFNLLGNTYYKVVNSAYGITSTTDFNVTYSQFKDYIISVNTQQATSVNQFGTLGVFAQTTTSQDAYLGNVRPDNSGFICVFYNYPNLIQDPYIQAPQVGASYAAVTASNDLPYNTTFGVILNGLPVSSATNTYLNVGINSSAENLLQYGYSPIAVNQASGQAYMYMPITTQTTVPGTAGEIDQEFYDVRTQQVRAEVNSRLDAAMKTPPFVNATITPKLIQQAISAIYNALIGCQNDNLIFNVDAWKPQIIVTRSNVNAHQLNISCVIQISPALTSVLITVNVVSSLISPPNTQA